MVWPCVEKTGSKLNPMTQPYLPFALALPASIDRFAEADKKPSL